MRKTHLLLVFLALLGLAVGSQLDELLSQEARPGLVVGESLLGAELSPDGRFLAGLGRHKSGDWYLQVWNHKGRVLLKSQALPSPPGRLPALAWSPDSSRCAVAAKSEVWVFEPQGGKKVRLPAQHQVRHLEYAQETLLARTDTITFIWDTKSYQERWKLAQAYLLHSVLDPSGKLVATACFEDGVRVFDLARGSQLHHFEAGQTCAGLQFSKGGQWLSLALRDRRDRSQDRVLTYDLKASCWAGPHIFSPKLQGFEICQDGSSLLTTQEARTSVWDPLSGQEIAHRPDQSRLLSKLSSDGLWVAGSGRQTVLWPSKDPSREQLLKVEGVASDVRFGNQRQLLLVAAGRATVWSY